MEKGRPGDMEMGGCISERGKEVICSEEKKKWSAIEVAVQIKGKRENIDREKRTRREMINGENRQERNNKTE